MSVVEAIQKRIDDNKESTPGTDFEYRHRITIYNEALQWVLGLLEALKPQAKTSSQVLRHFIEEEFGKRCENYVEGCPCCNAWKYFDTLTAHLSIVEREQEWLPFEALCGKVKGDADKP